MHHNPYAQYYVDQVGSGVYRGAYHQRGHGLGSILSSLFQSVFPLFKKVAPVVGSQLLKTGINTLHDMNTGMEPRAALKRRLKESGKNTLHQLGDMVGSGFIHRGIINPSHSFAGGPTVHKRRKLNKKKPVKKKKKKKTTKRKAPKKKKSKKKKSTKKTQRSKLDIFG